MGDSMILRDEDVGRICEYVKPWLRELANQIIPQSRPAGIDNQLLERMVRVEEELKTQRELMDERFGFVQKQFGELTKQMNQRFSTQTWMIGIGFVVITSLTTIFALLS